MRNSTPFTCRRTRWARPWALALTIAMTLMTNNIQWLVPTVRAQVQVAPVGNGFVINGADLRFIYDQILVSQDHAAGGTLLGTGPHQVSDPQLPRGLRTVD